MSNCIANSSMFHSIINLKNEAEVLESFFDAISIDNDLVENVEYYREDTLALGYDNEADRIIKEFIEGNGIPKTIDDYKLAFDSITDAISSQDYFGECETDFIEIDDHTLSVSFLSGGQSN